MKLYVLYKDIYNLCFSPIDFVTLKIVYFTVLDCEIPGLLT